MFLLVNIQLTGKISYLGRAHLTQQSFISRAYFFNQKTKNDEKIMRNTSANIGSKHF